MSRQTLHFYKHQSLWERSVNLYVEYIFFITQTTTIKNNDIKLNCDNNNIVKDYKMQFLKIAHIQMKTNETFKINTSDLLFIIM